MKKVRWTWSRLLEIPSGEYNHCKRGPRCVARQLCERFRPPELSIYLVQLFGGKEETFRQAATIFHVKFNQFAHQLHCQERLWDFQFTFCADDIWLVTSAKTTASVQETYEFLSALNHLADRAEGRFIELCLASWFYLLRIATTCHLSSLLIASFLTEPFFLFHCRSRKPKAHRSLPLTVSASAKSPLPTIPQTCTKFLRSCWLNHGHVRSSHGSFPLAKW